MKWRGGDRGRGSNLLHMKERIILHVDMDAFFASVEQKERPWLEGKPVIVGGDPQKRRGVVSAASYPARKYGVGAGMPLALAKTLCPHATFIILTDMEKYSYISSQLVKIFYHFTPVVEPFSIDEAFLDITGCQRLFGTPYQLEVCPDGFTLNGLRRAPVCPDRHPSGWVKRLAQKLKNEIKNEVGLPCSVGIAPNKLLAKLASSLNKPDGLTIISKDRVKETLYPLKVGKLWGIGEKTSKLLSKFGIRTVGDLASYPVEVLKNQFGKVGVWLHLMANGIDDSAVLVDVPIEKSMGHEHTLPKDTKDPDEIFSVLLSLSTMVARRLRQKRFQGRTVTLKLRYSDFVTLTRSETIPKPTDSEHKIYQVAKNLALNQYGSGQGSGLKPQGTEVVIQNSCLDLGIRKARLLGVSVSNLVRDDFSLQISFPFPQYYDKNGSTTFILNEVEGLTINREVYSAMDKIKDKFGEDSVMWATSLIFW
jgi:DNA polymerase-4